MRRLIRALLPVVLTGALALACSLGGTQATPTSAPTGTLPIPCCALSSTNTKAPPTAQPTATATPLPPSETPTEAGPCELAADRDTNVYYRPSLDSGVFGVLSPGQPVTPQATTADGWIGFDPGVAQAANVGLFRLRWVQTGDAITLRGGCGSLPVVQGPPAGACFEMFMADTRVLAAPDASAAVVVTAHGEDYAKVLGTSDDWYELDLSVGNLALAQPGWITSDAANFNGPCDGLPEVSP